MKLKETKQGKDVNYCCFDNYMIKQACEILSGDVNIGFQILNLHKHLVALYSSSDTNYLPRKHQVYRKKHPPQVDRAKEGVNHQRPVH